MLASLIEDDVIDEIVDADAVYEQVYKRRKRGLKRGLSALIVNSNTLLSKVYRHATAKRLAEMRTGTNTSQPFKYATQEDIDRAKIETPIPVPVAAFVDRIEGQATYTYKDKASTPIDGGPSRWLHNDRDARVEAELDRKEYQREEEREQDSQDAKLDELQGDLTLAERELEEARDARKAAKQRERKRNISQKEKTILKAAVDSIKKAVKNKKELIRLHRSEMKIQATADRAARFKSSRLWRTGLIAEFKKAYKRYPDGSAPCCSAADCDLEIAGIDKLARERLALHLVANCGVAVRNERGHMENARSGSFEIVFGADTDSKDNVIGMSLENYLSITKPWGYTEGLWKRGQLLRETGTEAETETGTDKQRQPNDSQQEYVTRLTGSRLERERKRFRNEPLDNVPILHRAGSEQDGDGGDADEPVSTMSSLDWTLITDERMRTEHHERFWQQEQTKVKGKRKRKRGIPIPAMDPRDEFYDRIIGQGIAVWRERWQEDKILKPKSAFLRDNPAAADGEELPSGWGPMPSEKSKWMKEVATLAEIAAHRRTSGNNSNERSNAQWESFAREWGSVLKAESFRSANLETTVNLFLHPDISRKSLPRKATAESIGELIEQGEAIEAARRELAGLWSWCEDMEAHGEDGCALIHAELTSRGYVLTEDGYM